MVAFKMHSFKQQKMFFFLTFFEEIFQELTSSFCSRCYGRGLEVIQEAYRSRQISKNYRIKGLEVIQEAYRSRQISKNYRINNVFTFHCMRQLFA